MEADGQIILLKFPAPGAKQGGYAGVSSKGRAMKLVIGAKNYSSWSMRPWLLLSHFQLDFEEVIIKLFTPGYKVELSKYSPTLRVPVLLDRSKVIWDSLAICEYVSEQYLDGQGLPRDGLQRAICRAYCSEMHSGFMAIRNSLPMNCRAKRLITLNKNVLVEVSRVDQLWCDALAESGGPYLFGQFSLADCMFAPIVMRFSTYQVVVSEQGQDYMNAILSNPAVQAWVAAAQADSQRIDSFEIGEDLLL